MHVSQMNIKNKNIPKKYINNFTNCFCEKFKDISNKCLQENRKQKSLQFLQNFTSKENYRPISSQSNFTKIFKNVLFMQLNSCMENKFSIYLTGFWKSHNTKHDWILESTAK